MQEGKGVLLLWRRVRGFSFVSLRVGISLLAIVMVVTAAMAAEEWREKLIFGFDKAPEIEQWQIVNDGVMGGVSKSTIKLTDKGTALFSGKVSLENFGGFASARSKAADRMLVGYEGVAVRVRGDGKKYKLTLKGSAPFGGFIYEHDFETEKEKWITVRVPFRDFLATFHGRSLGSRPRLEGEEVKSFGFLIADKQKGQFQLEVDWLKAYRKN
jgi:monofunctional biosynthetic peptidoglycan transglycosylase